jgi:hypothetical protein
MHLQIPADTPAGPLKIFWSLIGPNAPANASAPIDATPAANATHT